MPKEKQCRTFLIHMDKVTKFKDERGEEKSLEDYIVSFKNFVSEASSEVTTYNQLMVSGDPPQKFGERLIEKLNKADAVFILVSENFAKFINDESDTDTKDILPEPLDLDRKLTHDTFKQFFAEEVTKQTPKLFLIYTGSKDGKIPDCLDTYKRITEVSFVKKVRNKAGKLGNHVGYKEVRTHLLSVMKQ